jgi:hypothetical protein
LKEGEKTKEPEKINKIHKKKEKKRKEKEKGFLKNAYVNIDLGSVLEYIP